MRSIASAEDATDAVPGVSGDNPNHFLVKAASSLSDGIGRQTRARSLRIAWAD
jgi:hypothetical protein